MGEDRRVIMEIRQEWDVSLCLARVAEIAREAGLRDDLVAMVQTATSELARNILRYASQGVVAATVIEDGDRRGIEITAADQGPGIADTELAMTDNFSTGGTLGLGLPAARRMMDEFALESRVGAGTTVTARKWA